MDTTYGEKLHIHLNITFPMIPCNELALDIVDVSGAQQLDVEHNLHKVLFFPSPSFPPPLLCTSFPFPVFELSTIM